LEEYATLSGQYMPVIFDQFQSWLGFDNNSYLICILSHSSALFEHWEYYSTSNDGNTNLISICIL